MDEHRAIEIMSGAGGVGASLLRAGLLCAAGPYAAAMGARRWLYRRGLLPSRGADVPVICVGNITTGGTGKTPMVAWVVGCLARAGKRPAILTRGYKAVAGLSDEAELLKSLTGADVVVNGDRVAGAKTAVSGGADVLVMDDGYQHRRLRRDLDIVLVDAANPFGFGHCLPRGLLREPPGALRDAGAVVITRSDAVDREALAALRGRLASLAPDASLHAAAHRPVRLIDADGVEHSVGTLAGRKVMAFCGIASPESFFETLEALGADVSATRALADHVEYTDAVTAEIARLADNGEGEILVTTQKDYVKLDGKELGGQVWQLVVEMAIVEGEAELVEKVLAAAGGAQ